MRLRILWPGLLILVLPVSAVAESPKGLVGPLIDPGVIDGCSWSATSPETGPAFVFLAEYDESMAVMNIDRQDVQLKLDKNSSKGSLGKVGNRLHRRFIGISRPVVVEAVYVVTWRCPPEDQSCEVIRFNAVFTVRSGTRVETVKGKGEVGC